MRAWIFFSLSAPLLGGGIAAGHQIRPLTDMALLSAGVRTFEQHAGRLPAEGEGLAALVERPATYPVDKPWIQLFDELPVDPWGKHYRYLCPAETDVGFGLYSTGPDGASLSAGNDPDDWNSWSKDHRGRKTMAYYLALPPKGFYLALALLVLAFRHVVRGHRHAAGG
ncbi:type II secretion system protein GspG [Luteolibacter marinus]|uniref:type II secretion system protein GspG n=1 Tax=Luteolibacter marinus TaxID=2776705 RepID=UPI00186930A8|nr:type II secretion system protein GspG [Luteolibacter marinus]